MFSVEGGSSKISTDEATRQYEFKGKVALVTGAAGDGVGRATSRLLADRGANVVLTDIHPGRLQSAMKDLSGGSSSAIRGYVLDAGDREAIAHVLNEVAANVGPVQVLVNNAARTTLGDILDYSPDEFERLINLNLTSPWFLCMLAAQQMQGAGGGAIVNISSIAPQMGFAHIEPPYAAAKAGLHAITRGIAKAGGPYNVRCNTVAMGMVVETHFARSQPELIPDVSEVPLGRHATPRDIAEAVAFLASERASFISGELLTIGGGAYFGV